LQVGALQVGALQVGSAEGKASGKYLLSPLCRRSAAALAVASPPPCEGLS
jgi:hypothetical protein